MLMAALVLSTMSTVYAKGGNEVNVGEADSHLKVTSSKESQTTIPDSAAIDKAAEKNRQRGDATDKEPQPELAPSGQGAGDPSLPKNTPREKQKDTVKETQTHKAGKSKP